MDVEKMSPLYWMHEQSGMMKAIVLKYLDNEPLLNDELHTLKWYIHQFADAMLSKPIDLHRIFNLNQQELKGYLQFLLDGFEIDPL